MKHYIDSKANTKDDKEKKKIYSKLVSEIKTKNKLLIMQKAYKKYMVIKFRQKISFIAFINKKTIVELFLYAIMKSYNQMTFEGYIELNEK